MTFLLRVALPDQPGALGAVAGAIGRAGGDITGVDVVEHRDGAAVDDLLVDLPPGRMPDLLVTACQSVPGVRVEFVGRYAQGADLHRDLEAVEAMTADPRNALATLVDLMPGVFRSGWALAVRGDDQLRVHVVHASTGAPAATGFPAPWLPLTGPSTLDTGEPWAPESWSDAVVGAVPLDAAASPGSGGATAVLLGRDGGPDVRRSEIARLMHLVGLLGTITRR